MSGMKINPVSKLNQLAQQRFWHLAFKSEPPVGPPHMPTIEVTATISGSGLPKELDARAYAGSTKAAKQLAAEQLLEQLSATSPELDLCEEINNYKGALQEMLVKAMQQYSAKHLASPSPGYYEASYDCTSASIYTPIFTAILEVRLPDGGTLTTQGVAKTKKDAQQKAAKALLDTPEFQQHMIDLLAV